MSEQEVLKLDDKVKATDALYATMLRQDEPWTKWVAVAVAAVLHIVVLVVNLPEANTFIPDKEPPKIVTVKKYVPPPPPVERRKIERKQITKKVAVPDPTPDEPEPIREPEPEIDPEPLPPDVEIVIGDTEPPPPSGPLMAGVGDVTNPVLIPESKVEPPFPEIARRARLTGNVILQAIIYKDGTVGDVEVLRCTRPNVGFEEEAVKAVEQWRYQPATQNGRPVDVYFTIQVSFELN